MEKCVSSLGSQLLGRNTGAQVLSIFYTEVITSVKEFSDYKELLGNMEYKWCFCFKYKQVHYILFLF